MRDRVDLHDEGPDSERDSDLPPYISLREVTPEHEYFHSRLKALDGPLPSRPVPVRKKLTLPDPKVFGDLLAGSGKQEAATTMGFTRLLRNLEIGRASCRERVCQDVSISVVGVSLKKKQQHHT